MPIRLDPLFRFDEDHCFPLDLSIRWDLGHTGMPEARRCMYLEGVGDSCSSLTYNSNRSCNRSLPTDWQTSRSTMFPRTE